MITVNDLSFSYSGGQREAITRLNFEIDRGEVFGFLGPSGAGKSTTQKVLIRLLRQYQGAVSVFNRNLKDWGPDYFEQIGVSFEFPTHFLKLTGIENLTYFSRLYGRPTHSPTLLLRWVGLHDDGRMRVSQYSKGMKTRLSVARALLHSPELLFMDEPTAGLDPLSARRIKELIKEQKAAGKTVFLTTHDSPSATHESSRGGLRPLQDVRNVLPDPDHQCSMTFPLRALVGDTSCFLPQHSREHFLHHGLTLDVRGHCSGSQKPSGSGGGQPRFVSSGPGESHSLQESRRDIPSLASQTSRCRLDPFLP